MLVNSIFLIIGVVIGFFISFYSTKNYCIYVYKSGDIMPFLGNNTRKTFTIPIGNISKNKAEFKIAQLIKDYREDVFKEPEYKFTVNSKEYIKLGDIPFTKEIWFPQT